MRTSISLLLSFVSCAAAWGYDGHAAVGLVADAFLTEAARAQVSQRLATSMNFTSLREPALMNWADKVLYDKRYKGAYSWSKRFHFVNTKDSPDTGNCSYVEARDTGKVQDLVRAITNYTMRVSSPCQAKCGEDIAFLAHFTGDITQPLHVCGKERGGNSVTAKFSGRKTNLHSVWDTRMVRKRIQDFTDRVDWADSLVRRIINATYSTSGWVEDLTESPHDMAVQWALDSNSFDCNSRVWSDFLADPKVDLSGRYYRNAIGIAEELIAKSGYRLATLLNHLLV